MSARALLATAELRRVEAREQDANPPLMVRAGRAAADLAAKLSGGEGRPILVVAGPGNNGGDGWVAAARLLETFHRVIVFDVAGTPPRDSAAVAARAAFLEHRGEVVREWPAALRPALVVDAVLGIGIARAPEGAIAAAIERINASDVPVLALDVPSGLDADTGRTPGTAVRARATLTFIAAKPGLYTGRGTDLAGEVHVETLGLDAGDAAGILLDPDHVRAWLAPRTRDTHKGSFGTLGIVGGAQGMVGAALLAARAGLHAGAGKVLVGLLARDAPAFDPGAPELMLRAPRDALDADVVVAGCGAGSDAAVLDALAVAKPVVLDADALNQVAADSAAQATLEARASPTILTPHPGEAARLLGRTTRAVQDDRVGAALALSRRFRGEVVLKGAGSVVAHPDGRYSINTTGNAGLASGGTGDVLAGLIGALLCQGLPAPRALAYAVCLHGAAADALVARGVGPVGLMASEVILEARALINAWTH